MNTFTCNCSSKKNHLLELDGGIMGYYGVRLCSDCYLAQDKKFLIKERTDYDQSSRSTQKIGDYHE